MFESIDANAAKLNLALLAQRVLRVPVDFRGLTWSPRSLEESKISQNSQRFVTLVTSHEVVAMYGRIKPMAPCAKFAALVLAWTLGIFPSGVFACAGSTMQSCHPCCGHDGAPQVVAMNTGVIPPPPCCALSSGRQSPRTETQVPTYTAVSAKPIAKVAHLETPSHCLLYTSPSPRDS